MTDRVDDVVFDTLRGVLGSAKFEVARGSSHLFIEGFLDSFGMIELVAILEARLGIVIPVERMGGDAFATFSSIATLCRELGAT